MKKILVIDDDPIVLRSLEVLFKKQKWDVFTSFSGEDALKKIEKVDFDLVVTDIKMAGLDGVKTVKAIKAQCSKKNKPEIPVVFITGYADMAVQKEAQDLGKVLLKPFDNKDLIESVKVEIDFPLDLSEINASLRTKIKLYRKRLLEIEAYLAKKPEEWGRFQNEFNSEINAVFKEIMRFEKAQFSHGERNKVRKFRRIFINKVKNIFFRGGAYIKWIVDRPFGYVGDFKTIDNLYLNDVPTVGFDRLFDNYTETTAMSVAVRNRKDDFRRIIANFVNSRPNGTLRIMNLACGPCREIKELLSSNILVNQDVFFDCYDREEKALEFAKDLLKEFPEKVKFFKKNIARLGISGAGIFEANTKYDLIYSTGFFDYLSHRMAMRIVQNLKKYLNPGGILLISNVRDRYSNPSIYFMELVLNWDLIYRTEEEFKKVFTEAGFKEDNLKLLYEQQGIMQYIMATSD